MFVYMVPSNRFFLHCCMLTKCHTQKVKRCVTVHHGVHKHFVLLLLQNYEIYVLTAAHIIVSLFLYFLNKNKRVAHGL